MVTEVVIGHTEYPCNTPRSVARKMIQLLDQHYTGTVTLNTSEYDEGTDEFVPVSKVFVTFGNWPFQSYSLNGRKPVRFRSAATADIIRKCIDTEGESHLYL